MASMKWTIRVIEQINETVGRTVSWLTLLMVFTTCLVAVLRYGFNIGFVWLQELYIWMHAAVFLLASGYTLLHDGHVRIDLIYGPASLETKAWINIGGTIFFLFPMLALIFWVALPYVQLSWSRLETSQEAGGLHGLFLLKSCILLFVFFLALQGIALILRSILVLRGDPEWSPSNPTIEPAGETQ
ncbi:MAG: TRAP transporter small permease subunit [Hyphomicrobiaceae bacterium]|nr:TRAP transporter small permease subunit [Hyphomicrobiaceae bacterium]